jgi:hypothetical protein
MLGLEMTITVLLMTIMTGQNHTIVAEYNSPEACEVAALAHHKMLLENNLTMVFSCSPKAGSRRRTGRAIAPSRVCEREAAVRGAPFDGRRISCKY